MLFLPHQIVDGYQAMEAAGWEEGGLDEEFGARTDWARALIVLLFVFNKY